MILRSDPKYPIHRSYVMKLSRDATPDALCGRIENLVTGTHRDFTSARELLDLGIAGAATGLPLRAVSLAGRRSLELLASSRNGRSPASAMASRDPPRRTFALARSRLCDHPTEIPSCTHQCISIPVAVQGGEIALIPTFNMTTPAGPIWSARW